MRLTETVQVKRANAFKRHAPQTNKRHRDEGYVCGVMAVHVSGPINICQLTKAHILPRFPGIAKCHPWIRISALQRGKVYYKSKFTGQVPVTLQAPGRSAMTCIHIHVKHEAIVIRAPVTKPGNPLGRLKILNL